MKLSYVTVLCLSLIIQAEKISITKWKGDAHAAFSIIMDDFGSPELSPPIIKAGNMAAERGLKISTAVVVNHILGDPKLQWGLLNSFVAQGHEIVNHSWNHDNPDSSNWDKVRDMLQTRNSIEANLADSVWQKKVTFYAFPYDGGRIEDLDFLKEHGYIGARFTEQTISRINESSENFDPFYSTYYSYISKEYIDSALIPEFLAEGKDTTDIEWWLTYPDKEYPPFNSFTTPIEQIEQRHIELALKQGGWGLMEMHSISPEQLYPQWWSPMSYKKFEALLDRLAAAQDCDSLWIDVPSRIAAYMVLSNNTTLTSSDSLITFHYGDVGHQYFTELTLKIPTNGATLQFSQNGKSIPSHTKRERQDKPATVYINVDPSKGPVRISKNDAPILTKGTETLGKTTMTVHKNSISLMIPAGNYAIDILDMHGRKQLCSITESSNGRSPIIIKHSLASGTYIVRTKIDNIQESKKFQVP